MNLSELQAECGRLLNDPNHDTWSEDALKIRLNLAQTEVETYTHAVKTLETLTPTVGTPELSINVDTLNIIRVHIIRTNGSYRELDGIDRDELDFKYPDWQSWQDGEPQFYFWDASESEIVLVPAPDANYAVTNAVKVWEIREPTDMSASTDQPFESHQGMRAYHLAVVHWAVAQCYMDRGTPEALATARFHKSGLFERPGEFEKQIMRIRADFDAPASVPASILWRPQGGRLTRGGTPSKSYPLG